jgi:hypothetical protein
MRTIRPVLAEAVRAVATLALFLLALSHVPLAVGPTGAYAAAIGSSYCGDAPADRHEHAPCEACRIAGGAHLPPPCPVVVDIEFAAQPAAYGSQANAVAFGLPRMRPETRAPPAA